MKIRQGKKKKLRLPLPLDQSDERWEGKELVRTGGSIELHLHDHQCPSEALRECGETYNASGQQTQPHHATTSQLPTVQPNYSIISS